MIAVSGKYGGWEIDAVEKRLRWLGLHDGVTVPPHLLGSLDRDGVPRCEAERTGPDGWAPYDELVRCDVGGPFVVRWVDGAVMFVPTELTTVEETP